MYDPNAAIVEEASSSSDDEEITHVATMDGIYEVRVHLFGGSPQEGNAYDLEMDTSCLPAGVSGAAFVDRLIAPLTVPDLSAVNNCFTVDDAGTISDLSVGLTISHSWVGDLIVTLTHEDTGTSVILIDRPGAPADSLGCFRSDISVVLADAAASPIEDKCNVAVPTISGTFRPNEPLSAFDGEGLAGTWTLRVSDELLGDAGTLDGWSLTLAPPPAPTPFPAPIAPKNLQAIVIQDQLVIELFWEDNADNEAAYIVQRSVDGTEGPWPLIATLPPDTTMYADDGLTDGVTYWYRVAAEGSAARSDFSNIVFGTATGLPTPPVGDVDCSGSVTSIDAALVLQLSAGLVASLSCEEFADVNEDGELTSVDAALILQLTAGLVVSLPP